MRWLFTPTARTCWRIASEGAERSTTGLMGLPSYLASPGALGISLVLPVAVLSDFACLAALPMKAKQAAKIAGRLSRAQLGVRARWLDSKTYSAGPEDLEPEIAALVRLLDGALTCAPALLNMPLGKEILNVIGRHRESETVAQPAS